MEITAINYHYIRKSFEHKYPSIYGVRPKDFENQLIHLKKHGHFIDSLDIIKFYYKNESIKKKSLIITFDDGLKEQFLEAYPILQKLNIPSIFFLPGKPYKEKKVLNVHLIHIVRSLIDPNVLLSELKNT